MKSGWQTEKLGDVCGFLNRGISPKYLEQDGICVLNQRCIRDHHVSYEHARRHDSAAKRVGVERFIQLGDVLVNSTGTGTLGRVAQVRDAPPEPTTVDSHVTIVRPIAGKFSVDFFGYMLVFIEDAIKEAGEGCGGQTELARSVLAERFTVSYPTSLEEQQRIVTILDEAFEAIATARANAEKNLQNARALFESHLYSVFTQRGDGWVEQTLEEVGMTQTGSTPKTSEKENFGTFIPFLKPSDFRADGSLRYDNEGLSEIGIKKSRLVKAGSVLMVCIGGTIGKVGFCERDVTTNQQINSLTPSQDISHKLIYYQMLTEIFQQKVLRGSAQMTLPIINKSKWSNLTVHFPSTKVEQGKIVAKADALLIETQRLVSIYQRKIAVLDELKKSLLHQAFSGQLSASHTITDSSSEVCLKPRSASTLVHCQAS